MGLDDRAEVRPERPICALPQRSVRATKAPADGPVAAALGKVQMLLPAAVELDHPALWIGEPDSVEQFEPQRTSAAPVSHAHRTSSNGGAEPIPARPARSHPLADLTVAQQPVEARIRACSC